MIYILYVTALWTMSSLNQHSNLDLVFSSTMIVLLSLETNGQCNFESHDGQFYLKCHFNDNFLYFLTFHPYMDIHVYKIQFSFLFTQQSEQGILQTLPYKEYGYGSFYLLSGLLWSLLRVNICLPLSLPAQQ